jgi:multidrug efflux pump subunit AcrB
MDSLIRFFVTNWRFSLLATLLTLVVGMLSLGMLRKEAFPPVNFAVVGISTNYPGASPEEVQDRVTQVIEDELQGINGLKRVRSLSRSEFSEITIEIDIDTENTEVIVNDIQKAVQRASARLPSELREDPLVIEIKADEIPIFEVAIVGSNENRRRDELAEKLEEQFEDIKSVASVQIVGSAKKELQILLDAQRLHQMQVSIGEVVQNLPTQLKNNPAGFLDDKKDVSLVRVLGKQTTPKGIGELIVRSNDSGQNVKVKELGLVRMGNARPQVLTRINAEEATLLTVTKKSTADAITLVHAVQDELEKFKTTAGPDYKFSIYNNEGKRVENRLDIVNFNAISGIIVVLLILFLFLPGKVGLFSAMSLPICALGTVSFMIWQDAQFNIITMIALVICLGNLVDNSVVISEHYTSLRENGEKAADSAIASAKQFWIPFTASTITIISAFLPMIVTKGVMGQFIRWIPIIVTIALTLSLIESLTLLPARLQFLNPKPKVAHEKSWFGKVEAMFGRFIELTLHHKTKTLLGLSLLIGSGFVVTGVFNRFELFAAEGVEYYFARFEMEPQTSIFQTDEVAKQLSEEIKAKFPPEQLLAIVAKSGVSQVDPSDPKGKSGENVGIITIGIHPDWAPKLNIQETLANLRLIPKKPKMTKLTFEPMEGGPPIGRPLTLTLRSNNYEEMSKLTADLMVEIEKIDGVVDLDTDEQTTGTEYKFLPNRDLIARTSLNTDAVGLNISTALKGTPVAELTEGGRQYDVVVKFESSDATSVETIRDMKISNSFGNYVPLSRLGEFEKGPAPKTQRNFDFKRSITISSDVDVNKISALALTDQVRGIVNTKIAEYKDVSAVFGGEEESTNESLQSLGIALIIAIFGIFATLVFVFKSFLKPFIILTTIPLGLVGVFYAFAVGQRPLSFLAFIGIVGLSGVVINSAIILVDYIEELRASRKDLDLDHILVLASKQRLRAVMATGLTTVVGLLPTAFGLGGYDPILIPITLALSWGMIIGTVLSLVWIPSFYSVLFARKTKKA